MRHQRRLELRLRFHPQVAMDQGPLKSLHQRESFRHPQVWLLPSERWSGRLSGPPLPLDCVALAPGQRLGQSGPPGTKTAKVKEMEWRCCAIGTQLTDLRFQNKNNSFYPLRETLITNAMINSVITHSSRTLVVGDNILSTDVNIVRSTGITDGCHQYRFRYVRLRFSGARTSFFELFLLFVYR